MRYFILNAVIIGMVMASKITGDTTTEEPLPELLFLEQDYDLVEGDSETANLTLSALPSECINITFSSDPKNLTKDVDPIEVCPNASVLEWQVTIEVFVKGKTIFWAKADPPGIVNDEQAFFRLSVMVNPAIDVVGDVLGWIYTIAWDISFLPQIYHNWQRKSVVGLAFDFLAFNFIGFFCYFIFNMGNLWIPQIQDEFLDRHPTSVMHVRVNDVIFPLYALICTTFQIMQCFFYKRSPGQRVSTPCRIISAILMLSAIIVLIVVASTDKFVWLDLLYYLSYIKIAITCIKYTPQLYVNYRQKSTEGWSIWQVILDFTGGSLSLIQMFMLASNYDDWNSVLTDPAKLGLGLLSIFFNIFFFMQHFCLYKGHGIVEDDTPLKSVEEIQEKPSRLESLSSKLSRKGSTSSKGSELKGQINPDPAVHL